MVRRYQNRATWRRPRAALVSAIAPTIYRRRPGEASGFAASRGLLDGRRKPCGLRRRGVGVISGAEPAPGVVVDDAPPARDRPAGSRRAGLFLRRLGGGRDHAAP